MNHNVWKCEEKTEEERLTQALALTNMFQSFTQPGLERAKTATGGSCAYVVGEHLVCLDTCAHA